MANRKTAKRDGVQIVLDVAAATIIEQGKMTAVNAAGNAVPASNTAGLKVMGRAEQYVDNSGGLAGDLKVEVLRRNAFKFKNSSASPVTAADIGGNIMVEDAETVAHATSNSIVGGKCLGVDSDGVWVEIQ